MTMNMKLKNIILTSAAGLLAMTSCSDKMEYDEYNVYDKEYIQEMFGRVGGLMTVIYNDLDYDFGNYSGAMLSSATDESVYSHSGNTIEDFWNGAWGPTNDLNQIWTQSWEGISYCNLLLDEFTNLTFPEYVLDTHYQQEMYQYNNYQFEARWARAYFYFNLVRCYGDIPLKTTHMTADEANSLPQVPYDSIFAFIDSECAAIQDTIVLDYGDLGDMAYTQTENGRAGRLAVMALRARAALYYASPLFNPNNDQSRWLAAAQRSSELITAARNAGKSLASSYSGMFIETNWSEADPLKEILFSRRVAANNSFEKYNFPIGMENAQGGNCPTQNLVDAFEMTNGKAIDDDDSGYDPQNPYANRDARLAMIVAHNGDSWPNDNPNPLETFVGGANSSSVTYGTPTSYYLKKYINPATIIANTGSNSFRHNWVIFRLGEAYLNYAEAALNYTGDGYTSPTGLSMSAADAINMVRKRAKQPNIETGLSATEFREKYENERFVELCFEGHRFYDIRRWKEGANQTIYGMNIVRNTAADGTVSYTYTRTPLETRTWNDKYYLFPFPQADVMASGYTQNEGWGN